MYFIRLRVPHARPSIHLRLQALNLDDETWGIDDLEVRADVPSAAKSWGYNGVGELGHGGAGAWAVGDVADLRDIISAAGGNNHTLALRADGTVWAWGFNNVGQIGDGTTANRAAPVKVPGLPPVAAVAAGMSHSLALTKEGTVWAWGWNAAGQLGVDNVNPRPTAAPVPGLTNIVAIAAGQNHSVALDADGAVYTWGWNGFGQLGTGTFINRTIPARVPALSGVTAIVSGHENGNFVLALRVDGQVFAWGQNDRGQLGLGHRSTVPSPQSNPNVRAIAIAAGDFHAALLDSRGAMYAWGSNEFGQLGFGTPGDGDRLVPTFNGMIVDEVDLGASFSLVRKGQQVFAVGDNRVSQLGNGGSTTTSWQPVSLGYPATQVVAAGYHAMALRRYELSGALASVVVSAPIQAGQDVAMPPMLFTNTGSEPVTLGLLSVTTDSDGDGVSGPGDLPLYYSTPNACDGATVPAGGACAIPIRLKASALGTVRGDVVVRLTYPGGSFSFTGASLIATVVDTIDPSVSVSSPVEGAVYSRGQSVLARYLCTDSGSPVTCTAPASTGTPLDTSTPGTHVFQVTATDAAGNSTSVVRPYVVRESEQRGWQRGASLPEPRAYAMAFTLSNGRVVVAGGEGPAGPSEKVWSYDLATNSWRAESSMNVARSDGAFARLSDGRFLVTGGSTLGGLRTPTAEIFDPSAGAWTLVKSMSTERSRHTLTLLADGRVLATGGYRANADPYEVYQRTAEIYDPVTNSWTPVATMAHRRVGHTASLLPDGRVLIVGGADYAEYKYDVEFFHPSAGTFSNGPALPARRYFHGAVTLAGGRVLIAGGMNHFERFASALIYDPATNGWSSAGSMSQARVYARMVLMADGRAMFAGGYTGSQVSAAADVYDPGTGQWSTPGPMFDARQLAGITPLADGGVIVAGGSADAGVMNRVELWNASRDLPPVDTTPPVITPVLDGTIGANGWYTGDVSVSWTITDDQSTPAAGAGCAPTVLSTDGAVTFTCVGSSEGGETTASITIKRDATPPSISLLSPRQAAIYPVDASILANYACADTGSGLGSCTAPVPNGEPIDTAAGTRSFTVTSTDQAGNTATRTVSYTTAGKTIDSLTDRLWFNAPWVSRHLATLPDGRVLALSNNNVTVGVLNSADGSWTFFPGGFANGPTGVASNPVVWSDAGVGYLLGYWGSLTSYRQDGAFQWQWSNVYGCCNNIGMPGQAIDSLRRRLIWSGADALFFVPLDSGAPVASAPGGFGGIPALTSDSAYLASTQHITKWNITGPTPVREWSTRVTTTTASWNLSEPAITQDGSVVVTRSGNHAGIYAYTSDVWRAGELFYVSSDGTLQWTVDARATTPAVIGGTGLIYVGGLAAPGAPQALDVEGRLLAFSADGQLAWSVATPGVPQDLFVGDDERIYALIGGTTEGRLVAINRTSGVVDLVIDRLPKPWEMILQNGTVIVTGDAGITAVQLPSGFARRYDRHSPWPVRQHDNERSAQRLTQTRINMLGISGAPGAIVTLSALLADNGLAVPGESVAFSLFGVTVGTAITDGDGVARIAATMPVQLLGTHPGALRASFAGSSERRPSTATADVTILDLTPPVITITSPTAGALYALDAPVTAAFSCSDAASGIAECVGTVTNGAPLDTTAPGVRTFTVTAQDGSGNTSTQSVSYSIAPTAAVPATRVYVASWQRRQVSVYDGATHALISNIPTGSGRALAFNRQGTELYVAEAATVATINLATNTVTDRFNVGATPWSIAETYDSAALYVANRDSGTVSIRRAGTMKTVATGQFPWTVLPTPDHRFMLVSNYGTNTVSVFDAKSDEIVRTLTLPGSPADMIASPDGKRILVVSQTHRRIYVLDANTLEPLNDFDAHMDRSEMLAISPDGADLYVTASLPGAATARMDSYTGQFRGWLDAGGYPGKPAVAPHGLRAYTPSSESGYLQVYDTVSGTLLTRISTGGTQRVAVSPLRPQIEAEPATTTYLGMARLRARLTFGGQPLAERRVSFELGTTRVDAITGADGYATVTVQTTDDLLVPAKTPTKETETKTETQEAPAEKEEAAPAGARAVFTANFFGDTFYTGAGSSADVTILPATPTISLANGSAVYSGTAHQLAAAVTGVKGEPLPVSSITYNGSSELPVNAGLYTVVARFDGSAFYEAAEETATLTIAQAPLQVLANDAQRPYGDENPTFSATYEGFVTGEGPAVLGGTLAMTTPATRQSDVGTYPVEPSGLTSPNYALQYINGTLTITRAQLSGSFVAGGSFVYDGLAHAATINLTGLFGENLNASVAVTYNGASAAPSEAGGYAVVGAFAGTNNYAPHVDTSASITITPATTALALTVPPAAVFGEPITARATLQAAIVAVPQGLVTFLVDGATAGSGAFAGAPFTLTHVLRDLAVGAHTVEAVYSGSPNLLANRSEVVTVVVERAATSTLITASPSPSGYQEPVVLRATMAPVAPGAGTPTGSVEFLVDGAIIGTGAVVSDGLDTFATLTTSGLASGIRSIAARYLGDGNFAASSSDAVGHTVNSRAESTTTTVAAPASTPVGAQVTLTAVVNTAAGNTAITGRVYFLNGTTELGSAQLSTSGGKTTAALVTSFAEVGRPSITARYVPDGTLAASTSTPVLISVYAVTAMPPQTTTSSLRVARNVRTPTVTATADVRASGNAKPEGRVEFFLDGQSKGFGDLVNGEAAFTFTELSDGMHRVVAVFHPAEGSSFSGSTSAEDITVVK